MDRVGNQARVAAGLLRQLTQGGLKDRAIPLRIDTLIKANPQFGSRDRRLYRELLYTAIRYIPWIEPVLEFNETEAMRRLGWLAAETKATSALRAGLARDLPPLPPTLSERAAILEETVDALFPAWLAGEAPEAVCSPEADAQRSRAPLWIRLQTDDPAPVFAAFAEKGWTHAVSDRIAGAIRVDTETDATALPAFEDGLFEIQDIGSQAILASVSPGPGGRWLDACAGAGGKSLQLAALLGPSGRVDATDLRREALEELRRRATRARLSDRIRITRPSEGYDGVLVDAPCSGSGTWRRAPHLLWTTTADDLRRFHERQVALLAAQTGFVRPGGLLVYATCSQARTENESVAQAFLKAHPDFAKEAPANTLGLSPGPDGLRIPSSRLDGDAYFVAAFRKNA